MFFVSYAVDSQVNDGVLVQAGAFKCRFSCAGAKKNGVAVATDLGLDSKNLFFGSGQINQRATNISLCRRQPCELRILLVRNSTDSKKNMPRRSRGRGFSQI